MHNVSLTFQILSCRPNSLKSSPKGCFFRLCHQTLTFLAPPAIRSILNCVWVTRGEFMTYIEKDDPTEAPESGDKQPSPPDQK